MEPIQPTRNMQLLPSNGPNSNPLVLWIQKIPFVTRYCIYIETGIYFLNTMLQLGLENYVQNTTVQTILHYQVFRMFLSIFVIPTFIDWVFAMLTLTFLAPRIERAVGSAAFFFQLLLLGLLSNILFNVIMVAFAYNPLHPFPYMLLMPCLGFRIILFGLITYDCLLLPDPPQPCIKNKHIPLMMLFLFIIMGSLAEATAVVTGYLFAKGWMKWLTISSWRLQRWEHGPLRRLTIRDGYIENWACSGYELLDVAVPFNSSMPVYNPQAFTMAPAPPPPRSFAAPCAPHATAATSTSHPENATPLAVDESTAAPSEEERNAVRQKLAAAAEARLQTGG